MKAKIEWYQEVLELEPSSKVFFPLARLLGDSGEKDEAIRVLRCGLDRHPEYIEARLLLVQLLCEQGHAEQCADEVVRVTGIFAAYPGFWEAWSRYGAPEQTAMALGFLAAGFRHPGLQMQQVFAKGLEAIHAGSMPAAMFAPVAEGSRENLANGATTPAADAAKPVIPVAARSAVIPPAPAPALDEEGAQVHPFATALRRTETAGADARPVLLEVQHVREEGDEPTLRTRSMAEVLAEQGDVQGAVQIYEELLAASTSRTDARELQQRITALKARMTGGAEVGSNETNDDAGQEQHKVLNMLETLAQRLDARAQA